MYPCKKCRGPVPDGETICPVCGWDQAQEPPAAEKKAPETIRRPPAAEGKAPEAIGKPPAADSRSAVGKPPAARQTYQPTIRSCPACGGPLGADDRTCTVCGLQDPFNARPEDIAEYRRRREQGAAEEAARTAESERWKAKMAAEAEQKKAAVRFQISTQENERTGLLKRIKFLKTALTTAVIILIVGVLGLAMFSRTSRKVTLSGNTLPEWTAESKMGDVVRFTATDVTDWFTVSTTTTYSYSSPTTSYKGFAGLKADDGRTIYIYYYIPNGDAVLTVLANKYDNITLLEFDEFNIPMVSDPFELAGRLVEVSSVISTTGFDSSSMKKYNEIKDIPFLDTSVTSTIVDVTIEGGKERRSLFTAFTVLGLILTLAGALLYSAFNKKLLALNGNIINLGRKLDHM